MGKPRIERGRLTARPGHATATAQTGQRRLGLSGKRDGLLYVPESYRAGQPAPLAVMLHGAGGDGFGGSIFLRRFVDERGLILVAPESRGRTWDFIVDDYGADVQFIDRTLEEVFASYSIDPTRLAIGGFSDGASYALSLGITNGDLFTHVVGFSPGFAAVTLQRDSPRFYISHGVADRVLPIDSCSRKIVPRLKRIGYDVCYREFDGPHTVPHEIAAEAMTWFLQPGSGEQGFACDKVAKG